MTSIHPETFLLYLAKPTYGGWVSFTAHLALKYGLPLYKVGKTTEKRERPFGYGVNYRNISKEILEKMIEEGNRPLITAIDKNYYNILTNIPYGSSIVIHDPTEFNKSAKKTVLDLLPHLNVITIRNTVHELLEKHFGIGNVFLPHPYVSMFSNKIKPNNRDGAVSISRIDYDKNIELIVKANGLLSPEKRVEIYGEPNELYIYRKLKDWDSFKKDDKQSMYRGHFPKDFDFLRNLLASKKYVIDMSTIHQDGGGTQYTFLEAIDAGCILILNSKWVNSPHSILKDGINCIAVSDENELANVLDDDAKKYKLSKIQKEAQKIIEFNQDANWETVL